MQFLVKDWLKIKPNIKLFIASAVVVAAGWGLAEPFYSLMIGKVVGTPDLVGYLIGFANLISFLIAFVVGELYDRVNILRFLLVGRGASLLYIGFFAAAVLTGNVAFIIIAFLFRGLTMPVIAGGNYSYLEKKVPKANVSRIFGFNMSLSTLCWAFLVGLAIFLAGKVNLGWLLLGPLVGSVISIFIILLIIKKREGQPLKSRRIIRLFPRLNNFRSYGMRVNYALLISFLSAFVDWIIFAFIPITLMSMGFSLSSIALVMLVTYLPEIATVLFGEWADRVNRFLVIFLGLLLSGFSLMLISMSNNEFIIMGLAFLVITGLVATRPAVSGIFNAYVEEKHLGEVSGLKSAAGHMGGILGPVFVAFIYAAVGLHSSFFFVGLIVLAIALMSIRVSDRKGKEMIHRLFIPYRHMHRRA